MGSRRPFERRTEKEKRRIVHEVNQGIIGIRAACRKYGLNRNTLRSWRPGPICPLLLDNVQLS